MTQTQTKLDMETVRNRWRDAQLSGRNLPIPQFRRRLWNGMLAPPAPDDVPRVLACALKAGTAERGVPPHWLIAVQWVPYPASA